MIDMNGATKTDLIRVAHALADAARVETMRHFRTAIATEAKNAPGTRFDPVTVADRACELAMRAILADRRPDDGILGEEFGISAGTSGLQWVLDPIDGTRGYISGTPTWGVLISVADSTGPQFGIIDQPFIRERFEGGFGIARVTGPMGELPLQTRPARALSEAILLSTFPEIGTSADLAGFRAVATRAKLTRYGMDCYGYALLAAGQVDLVVEAGLLPYDIQAPIAVIQAAGGIVTNWQGGPCAQGGRVLAAANPAVHAEALEYLQDA